MKNKKAWFTLVELIIVVVILALLSWIGFMAYVAFLSNTRDANRKTQLITLFDALNTVGIKAVIPIPDNAIRVEVNNTLISQQWYIWKDVLYKIGFSRGWQDPKNNEYFTYVLSWNRKNVQIMAYMEDIKNLDLSSGLYNSVYANYYEDKEPYVYGKRVWVFVDTSTNIALQDDLLIQTDGEIDILTSTKDVKVYISNDTVLQGTGSSLFEVIPNYSCSRIKELSDKNKSENYLLNPDGVSSISTFCDMTVN